MIPRSSRETRLPKALQDYKREIEAYCGFELPICYEPTLADRGTLTHDPMAAVVKTQTWPPTSAVIAHELCHAYRYFNCGVPFMMFEPTLFINRGGVNERADFHLDNMLEHLYVLGYMQERFGFPPDPTHIGRDYEMALSRSGEALQRKSVLLCNWLLANYHFPQWVPEYAKLLNRDQLTQTAEVLLQEVRAAGPSKPMVVAALVRALGIDFDRVQLRRRSVQKRCDEGAPLIAWLAAESDCPPAS
jgi:hypothetical protein